MNKSTIVAVATPLGYSGVGVIRLSGSLARKICFLLTHKKLIPRYAMYTSFFNLNKDIIEKGLVIFFPKPNSYTGEDIIEFFCHGNPLILYNLVSLAVKYGAREAHPGEFTLRSFLNGKIDLHQAESVYNLINARSSLDISSALNCLSGSLSRYFNLLFSNFFFLQTYTEAAINFFDSTDFLKIVKMYVKDLLYCLNKILLEYYYTVPVEQNNMIVIVGKPNVGKSSLFNLLLKEDYSIVSPIAGTTRDILKEKIFLSNNEVIVADTAGLNFLSTDCIELEGIKRTKNLIKKANIIIFLFDVTVDRNFCLQMSELFPGWELYVNKNSKIMFVGNKIDLLSVKQKEDLYKNNKEISYISTRTLEGFVKFLNCLTQLNKIFKLSSNFCPLKTNYLNSLLKIKFYLEECFVFLMKNFLFFEDLLNRFHLIYYELLLLTGKSYDKSLLDNVFSKFCIGK